MKIAIDIIIESFPHTTINHVSRLPMHKFMSAARLQLNTNAASIHSHRRNFQLGLLFFTLRPEFYNTVSTVRFIPPTNPGSEPIVPEGSTGPKTKYALNTKNSTPNTSNTIKQMKCLSSSSSQQWTKVASEDFFTSI